MVVVESRIQVPVAAGAIYGVSVRLVRCSKPHEQTMVDASIKLSRQLNGLDDSGDPFERSNDVLATCVRPGLRTHGVCF